MRKIDTVESILHHADVINKYKDTLLSRQDFIVYDNSRIQIAKIRKELIKKGVEYLVVDCDGNFI
jgi:glyceraldehyde-3-phosphate dehydrogenase/erythrose-4-phosphate dehydrogenase